jgi:hypothetical protein
MIDIPVGSSLIFMDLPGSINVDTSVRFNPRRGKILRHGLTARLQMDAISLAVDSIQTLLASLRVTESVGPNAKASTPHSIGAENTLLQEAVLVL